MANFLTHLFSKDADNLANAIGDAINNDDVSTSEQKDLEDELAKAAILYDLELTRLNQQEKKAIFGDTIVARGKPLVIQQSEHVSWLAKNVPSLLAIGIITLTFIMYFWIIGRAETPLAAGLKEIIIYILGALTTIATQVVAYYFGSSQGSQEKQKSMDKMTEDITRKIREK